MNLVLLKILISFLLAVVLTSFAETKSIRWASILSATPNVSLIVMLFIGIEQGVQFSSVASVFGVYGLAMDMVFVSVIMLATFWVEGFVVPLVAGIIVYLLLGFGVVAFAPSSAPIAILICTVTYGFSLYTWRKVPYVTIERPIKAKKNQFLFQFSLITFITLFVTYAAPFLKEKWAGILSTFCGVTTSVGIIILVKYSGKKLRSFFKSSSTGLFTTGVYFFTLVYTYQEYGVAAGTLVSALICVAVLIGLQLVRLRLASKT